MLGLENPELRILLGNSIPLPEEDLDDANVASQFGQPHAEDALRDFYFTSIALHIGKDDFQYEFTSVIDFVRPYPIEDRISLCYSILKRIKEVYDFEFSRKIEIKSELDIEHIFDLIKFIEYDNSKLIVGVWRYIFPKQSRFNFVLYCEQNKDKILSEIDEQIDIHNFNPLIVEFVKSYEGDSMIEWFCKQSEKLETEIKIEYAKE
jgi:hypothetical protein